MSIKSILKFVALVWISSLATGYTSVQADEKKTHNIVFQVLDEDPGRWKQVLSISKNVQQLLGRGNVEIEIVVHSGGLNMVLLESEVGNSITDAQNDGIVFAACAATMKRHKFTEKDLHQDVKVVPIGAVEIMQKQEAGWTYIRL
jgi:intracellular sulfur oxidation DsrE/DsrF family protein